MFDGVLEKLKPAVYNWKNDDSGKKSIGFIAQDLLEIFPEDEYDVVVKQPNGFYAVNYHEIIPILTKEIQKLKKEVEELKNKK